MSLSAGGPADVLDTDAPDSAGRPPRALAVAVGLLAVLASVVVALLQRGDPPPSPPVEVVGSMLLEDVSSRRVELPFADEQHRDGVATGEVQLELPDRRLQGDVRLDFGASVELVGDEPVGDELGVVHAWGSIRLRFGSTTCRGSFGWSTYLEPLEGGGAMHVSCDDGATITGSLAATPQPQFVGVAIDVEDGAYVAGG